MESKLKSTGLIATFILMFAGVSNANNLQIGTPTQPAANQIQFTISWSNAWNNSSGIPANWDAAWVFVKQQDCSASAPQPWNHVTLTSTPGNNTVTGGSGNLQVDTSSDGMGVFIRVTNASSPFAGSVSGTVTLTFASTPANTDNYKVFGVEMVYVPSGSYYLGDGVSNQSYNNLVISSEAAITNVYNTLAGGSNYYNGALVAGYPKGVNAFYCMKYEITQHQWVDFLNTLNYSQQASVMAVAPSIAAGSWAMGSSSGTAGFARNSIKIVVPGISSGNWPATYGCDLGGSTALVAPNGIYNEAFDGQDIACNWLSAVDLEYYLSWSALRPMTTMEYEKACRGVTGSNGGEYAWGTTTMTYSYSYGVNQNNSSTQLLNGVGEVPLTSSYVSAIGSTGLCICGNSAIIQASNTASSNPAANNYGPMRVGAAAASSTSRVTGGATYWGIMDMTGNVWERTIGTSSAAACGFGGSGTLHGVGTMTLPASWPTNYTSGPGDFDVRGGGWDQTTGSPNPFPVSARPNAYTATYTGRVADGGGRGVRTHQ